MFNLKHLMESLLSVIIFNQLNTMLTKNKLYPKAKACTVANSTDSNDLIKIKKSS